MAEMDLNIDNYSITDLENFFKLKKGRYTDADIEQREYEIREQLLSSGHINKKFKKDLIDFLTEVKERLSYTVKKDDKPTTIAKNTILDRSNVPKSAELATSRTPLIIERPPTNYINVQQSEYYQGTMNPLATRIIPKNITVDTRFRNNYYSTSSSNFTVQFPTRLSKVVSMQLTSIELPRSFYNICAQYANNYFYLEVYMNVNGVIVGSERMVVIPDGNYTPEGLISQINSILCPGGTPTEDDACSYITFTLSAFGNGNGSGRTIVQPNFNYPQGDQIEQIVMNFGNDAAGNNDIQNIAKKLGWILGFVNIIYCESNYHISEKPLDCNPIKYLYLAVEDFNKSVNDSFVTAFEKNGLSPNILARISMYGNGYQNMIYNKDAMIVTETRKYFGPVDVQRLQVKLYDDAGRILNMNYSDYSFCLHFELLYDL